MAERRKSVAGVVVKEIEKVTPELVQAVGALIWQLSSSAPRPTVEQLTEIVASPATVLLVAYDGAALVGTLTLVLFRVPTGMRAVIEDVVVDQSARGRGVGAVLTRQAIERARVAGARTVDLTSRPSREAANRLYQRLGFVLRGTNAYRYSLD